MRLALRELRRRPGRFLVASGLVAFLTVLLLLLGGLLDGLFLGSTGAIRAQEADVFVYSREARQSFLRSRIDPELRARVARVPGVADVSGLGVALLGARVPGETDVADVTVVGYEEANREVPAPPGPDEAYADRRLEASGVDVGDTLQVGPTGDPLRVIGWVHDTSFLLQGGLWVEPGTWRAILADARPDAALRPGVFQVLTARADGVDAATLAARIDDATGGATRDVDPRRGDPLAAGHEGAARHLQPDHRDHVLRDRPGRRAVLRAAHPGADRPVRGAEGDRRPDPAARSRVGAPGRRGRARRLRRRWAAHDRPRRGRCLPRSRCGSSRPEPSSCSSASSSPPSWAARSRCAASPASTPPPPSAGTSPGASTMAALEMRDVRKVYGSGEQSVVALDHATLTVADDEIVALLGPSGSGKTTLLSIAGGLLSPTEGGVRVGDRDIAGLSARELTAFRQDDVGFVFQAVNLVPFLTAFENLLVVAEVAGRRGRPPRERADRLLGELGLEHRRNQLPGRLSGGERQRVAIGRALMNEPALGARRRADLVARHPPRRAGDGAHLPRGEAARHRGRGRHPRHPHDPLRGPRGRDHRRAARGLTPARCRARLARSRSRRRVPAWPSSRPRPPGAPACPTSSPSKARRRSSPAAAEASG